MHELSIAASIVDLAEQEARKRGVQVTAVHLKLGALSGVVKEALLGSYELATAGTALEGSRLLIEDVPVAVFCPRCNAPRELASLEAFRCPACGEPAGEVVTGAELQVTALEVEG